MRGGFPPTQPHPPPHPTPSPPPPHTPPLPSHTHTQIFVGTDPNKPALRTEGLLPADVIVDIVTNDLQARELLKWVCGGGVCGWVGGGGKQPLLLAAAGCCLRSWWRCLS